MDKWTIVRRMKQDCGGADFITLSQFCRYMGIKDPYKAKKNYLDGLDRVSKRYYIPDVVDRMMQRRTTA